MHYFVNSISQKSIQMPNALFRTVKGKMIANQSDLCSNDQIERMSLNGNASGYCRSQHRLMQHTKNTKWIILPVFKFAKAFVSSKIAFYLTHSFNFLVVDLPLQRYDALSLWFCCFCMYIVNHCHFSYILAHVESIFDCFGKQTKL